MKKIIIGVMGPGSDATNKDIKNAYTIGSLIAKNGWIVLSGGMNHGVMDAVNKGAKENNGLTLGILPTDDKTKYSKWLDIQVITNLRSGRNYINVLSSDVVIACGISAGTTSEIALAIQAGKQIILLNDNEDSKVFFKKLAEKQIHIVKDPEEAIMITKKILSKEQEI